MNALSKWVVKDSDILDDILRTDSSDDQESSSYSEDNSFDNSKV